MRALLLLVLMLLLPVHIQAAEEKNIPPAISFDVQELPPGWWHQMETMSYKQKFEFLESIGEKLQDSFGNSEDETIEKNLRVILQLIKKVKETVEKPLPSIKLEDPRESYSVQQWLELFRLKTQLNSELLLYSDDSKRLKSFNSEHQVTISEQLISYRNLPPSSHERLLASSEILRQRFEQIMAGMQRSRISDVSKKIINKLNTLEETINYAIEHLGPTPERIKSLDNALEKINARIARVNTEAYKLKIKQIASDAHTATNLLALLERSELFKNQIKLLSLQQQKITAELEKQLEESTTGTKLELPPQQEITWEELQPQLKKLIETIPSLLNLIEVSSEFQDASKQDKAWNRLKELRRTLKTLENQEPEIGFLLSGYQKIAVQQHSWWELNWMELQGLVEESFSAVNELWYYPLFLINDSPITITSLIWFVVIMLLAIFMSRLLRKGLSSIADSKRSISESSLFTIGRILHYLIISVALLIAFSMLGIDFSNLAIVVGALGVGIGFGLQSIFNNFISGLILLFERPLKVGDLVELESGVRGRIKSINVRSTQITTLDNIDILVPNSEFISGRVINFTYTNDLRRLHVPFGVAYGSDKKVVQSAAIEAALNVSFTLNDKEHAPDVWLVNFGDNSLDFELIVWIKGNKLPKKGNPIAIYLWELETTLSQQGLEIPFPQRDLHLRTVSEEVSTELSSAAKTRGNK